MPTDDAGDQAFDPMAWFRNSLNHMSSWIVMRERPRCVRPEWPGIGSAKSAASAAVQMAGPAQSQNKSVIAGIHAFMRSCTVISLLGHLQRPRIDLLAWQPCCRRHQGRRITHGVYDQGPAQGSIEVGGTGCHVPGRAEQ